MKVLVLNVEIGEEIGAISNLNSWILCWLVNDNIRSRVPGLFMKFHRKKLENHCLQSWEIGRILLWRHEWDEGPTDEKEYFILQKDVINKEYLWCHLGEFYDWDLDDIFGFHLVFTIIFLSVWGVEWDNIWEEKCVKTPPINFYWLLLVKFPLLVSLVKQCWLVWLD